MPIAQKLWGDSSRVAILLALAAFVIFLMLGAAQLWNHEGRWASICLEMYHSGDLLHPQLFGQLYYDKPVASYWLMVGLSALFGTVSEWTLRVPAALAGLLTIWCTFRLGATLFRRGTGLLAGYLLASCFMFIFWARVATADMLNVAGVIGAVTWYVERRTKADFVSYVVFFLMLAIGCLMKGLVAVAVVFIVLLPDLLYEKKWRRHLRVSMIAAALVGAGVYLAPFLASGPSPTAEGGGLWKVLYENIVRFLNPFDHQDVPWLYLQYLPLYLLPWTLFVPFAAWRAIRNWKSLSPSSRWMLWAFVLILLFFTASGSRRPYYILPIYPFAALAIADWIHASSIGSRRVALTGWMALASWLAACVWFGVLQPYTVGIGGLRLMSEQVRKVAENQAAWNQWSVACWEASRSAAFYFQTERGAVFIDDEPGVRAYLREHPRAILVTRRKQSENARRLCPGWTRIEEQPREPEFLGNMRYSDEDLVAFIPQ